MTYLLLTVPEMTTSVPLLCTVIGSPGNSCLTCWSSSLRSRRTMTSYRLMPPARSHTNIEIVPGALPWIRSCPGEVTIASATSGLVSETRVIGWPTVSSVERPTSSATSVSTGAAAAGAAAATMPSSARRAEAGGSD